MGCAGPGVGCVATLGSVDPDGVGGGKGICRGGLTEELLYIICGGAALDGAPFG